VKDDICFGLDFSIFDRIDVVGAAPIPLVTDPGAARRGEAIEQIRYGAVAPMHGDQFGALKRRFPFALATGHENDLVVFIAEGVVGALHVGRPAAAGARADPQARQPTTRSEKRLPLPCGGSDLFEHNSVG
jgi:hypothetical protein